MKIFINDIILHVIYQNEAIPRNMEFIEFGALRNFVLLVLKSKENSEFRTNKYGLIAVSEKIVVQKLKKEFKFIKAAGGVVKNDLQQILVIKRNNKWDIPKGKAERGESMKETAEREVKEECGLNQLVIEEHLLTTYHFYKIGPKIILKKTRWYNMQTHSEEKLLPQIDEGITEVCWVEPSFFSNPEIKTYRSIKEVIKMFNEPNIS
jgi:8-oxo-dGTP pyrophosphatase MutT (NUDIX family)